MTVPLPLAVEAGHTGGISLPALVLGVVLLLANGFFVAAEIALLAARRARIEELADGGDRRAVLALASLRELSVTFSGAQLGITMASLGLGAVAEPAVAAVLVDVLGLAGVPETARPIIAFTIGLAIVVFLHMVVGEMAPKNLALARAEQVSLALARPFRAFVWLLRPLIVLLNTTANGLVRLLGVEPVDEHNLVHTPDELVLALRESRRHGTMEPHDVRVMTAALRLAEIDAAAAMTPRVDLVAVSDTATGQDVLTVARETGFTRLPVYHRDLDDVVGLVHVKDVLTVGDRAHDVTSLLRAVPAVPGSVDLERLLPQMIAERAHAVLVVDEYGGTAGLLTLEDVIEELVGEIVDEFDREEREARRAHEQTWVVAGTLRRDELERLAGVRLPEGETETVSGYVTESLGRLVRRNDVVETPDGWRLRVVRVQGRRAGEVEVTAPPVAPGGGQDGDE